MTTSLKIGIIIIILVIIGLGSYFLWQTQKPDELPPEVPSVTLTPQEVYETWFESQVKGDWDKVFANMVDIDGEPYTPKCQELFKESFGAYHLGAEYTLDIEEEVRMYNCQEDPMALAFGVEIPEGECMAIPHSLWLKPRDGIESTTDSETILRKVNNQWKVVMWCEPLRWGLSPEEEPAQINETMIKPKVEKLTGSIEEMLATCDQKFITRNNGTTSVAPELDECYEQALENVTTIDVCEKAGAKGNCYVIAGVRLSDVSACKKITFFATKLRCFVGIAVNLNKPEICEQADKTGNASIGQCYIRVAVALKNPLVCEKINESDQCLRGGNIGNVRFILTFCKESCYFDLAKELKNPSLCDHVGSAAIDACIKAIDY